MLGVASVGIFYAPAAAFMIAAAGGRAWESIRE
jgi:hypothetical protein